MEFTAIAAGLIEELTKHIPRDQIHVSEPIIGTDSNVSFTGSTYALTRNYCTCLLIKSRILIRIYDTIMIGIRVPWESDEAGYITANGYMIKAEIPFELPNSIELVIAKVFELYHELADATD